VIEFDVETTGLQWYSDDLFLAQFYDPDDPECWPEACTVCGGTIDHEGVCEDPGCEATHTAEALVYNHPADSEEIQRWLDKSGPFRAWNSKFDLHFLEKAGYKLPDPATWHDGMVMAHLLDERRSVALQAVGDTMFGTEPWPEGAGAETEAALKEFLTEETKRRRKESKETGVEMIVPNYSDVPEPIMTPYAAHDVLLTRRVCEVLEPKMSEKLWTLYRLEMRVLAALYDVERRGLNIDRESTAAFEAELEGTLDRQVCEAAKLAAEGGHLEEDAEFNPKSTQQVGKALVARGADLTFARKLKSGLPSTDNESLEAILDPLARTILDFRSTEKLYGTYVHPMLHSTIDSKTHTWRAPFVTEDDHLHANFRQVGTRTGRMSSAQPNVQNWHRDDLRMRHVVQAQPGYKLVTADLDSIELKLFAAFVGPGILLDFMTDPESDMHTYTAKMLSLEDFDRGEGHIESARQRGKKYNYLTIYGGGVRAMMRWFHVDKKRAREMERAYHEAFPEIGPFQEDIEIRLEDKGYVESPWGRRHRPYDVRNVDREAYKFVNYLVQGTAGDLIKEATARCYEDGLPIITIVHDEIMTEVPEAEAEDVSERLIRHLTDHPRITEIVPLGADAAIVDRWSYAKKADFIPDYAKETA
jgi:DNA polymerase-1